jgi:phage-related minor tail protein
MQTVPGINGGTSFPTASPMAEGGIVTRPTFALIGEAGPEAVVPLRDGGMGRNVKINFEQGSVTINSDMDAEAFAEKLGADIERKLRR